jgi:signal transduction histidine kinase
MIHIDISDTGKWIITANMSKIFNPGYSTKKRGWGLGLTLAKRIVENYHEGKLTLKSTELNKGSTFRISLPKPV